MEQSVNKPTILLVGWEQCSQEDLIRNHLQKVYEKYCIIFAQYDTQAFRELAQSALIKQSPIRGIVFKRSFLVIYRDVARAIRSVGEDYLLKESLCVINMIIDDTDEEAKKASASADFARNDDWDQVLAILNSEIK